MSERPQILQEREKTHGTFKDNSLIWHKMIMSGPFPVGMPNEQILSITQIYLKLARIMSGNFKDKDHWKDLAGYAELGAEACE